MADTKTRQRVKALAERSPSQRVGLQAGWIVRRLIDRWPPRCQPAPVVLKRRDGVSDAQWDHVHEQIDIGIAELAGHGVRVYAYWTPDTAGVGVNPAGHQLSLLHAG